MSFGSLRVHNRHKVVDGDGALGVCGLGMGAPDRLWLSIKKCGRAPIALTSSHSHQPNCTPASPHTQHRMTTHSAGARLNKTHPGLLNGSTNRQTCAIFQGLTHAGGLLSIMVSVG